MCGIAGFVSQHPLRPKEGDAIVTRMVQTIRHRGPDAYGSFTDNGCTLGHARLSIIDLSSGDQPMVNEDGSLHITFNGEIYNYLELRAGLLAKGHRFSTRSDTEVILHLYEELGDDCVHRMNGQWAFAIWDSLNRQLFLSRDRLGVRPIFYYFSGTTFLFASEIKALFAYPGVAREIDPEALNQVFTFWHTVPPTTAFRNVMELPPGHSALVRNGRIAVRPYWHMRYEPGVERSTAGEELMSILQDAVRLRLRSDVPVGAYLSGGIDSSVITALIQRSGVARLRTFSVRFDSSELDEGAYQQDVVRELGTEHDEIRCSDREVGVAFPEAMWHIEKPILRTAPVPLFLLSKLVHQNGYKVVLTGEGADEVLGGYDIFKEAKIRSFWARQPSSSMRPKLLRRLYPYMPQIQSQSPAYLKAFFHIDREDVESPFFSHLPRWRLTSKLRCLLSDEWKNMLLSRDPVADLSGLMPARFATWDAFLRAQYMETCYLLPGYILSSQGDRVAMAHSVEGRFPFLDHRLIEFAAKLPIRLKMNALQEKYLLKKYARTLVPLSVFNRPKQPYRAPDARSFFCSGTHEYVSELLSPERIQRDGIFNPSAVQKLVEKATSGRIAGVADNMAAVAVLSTQLVVHEFIHNYPWR